MFRNRLIVTVCTILLLTGLPFGQALAGTAYAAPAAAPIAAGRAPAQSNSAPPSILSTVDPVPTYAITWTATGKGFTDVTDAQGTRTVTSHKITEAGSGIWRTYADGHLDYLPYNLTITDDWDEVVTSPCAYGGTDRHHSAWSITDPGRYTSDPNTFIVIYAPDQRPDNTWYMLDPFSGFAPLLFSYRYDSDDIWCNGQTTSGTSIVQANNYVSLILPGVLEGDALGTVFTKNTQFVSPLDPTLTVQWNVTVRVLCPGSGNKISSLNSTFCGRDLTVDRLEVTQGLQDGANTLPLVQGRRTVVRAYIGTGQDPDPVPFVTGILYVYTGSTLLGIIPPFNLGSSITALSNPDWHQINDTLNFEVPDIWTLQPSLRLEVEVNPSHSIAEGDYNNNKLDASLPFLPCGKVSVSYLPIRYNPDNTGWISPSTNISGGAEFMRKIYPVPNENSGVEYFPSSTADYFLASDINSANVAEALLTDLSSIALSSSSGNGKHVFGWMPAHTYMALGGGHIPGVSAFGNDTESPVNFWRVVFAHEIGHNLGLNQATSSLTTAGAHWFDVIGRTIKPVSASIGGIDLIDFMAGIQESDAWISPQNYKFLFNKICSGGAGSVMAPNQSLAVVDTLLVTGMINNTTPATGSLDPLYHFTTIPTYTLPVGSQYCVNLKDTLGALLSQYCFNQGFTDDSGTPVGSMHFGMVVPYPVGLNRVELVKSGSLLSAQVARALPTYVTVTYPNNSGLTLSGAQDITWTTKVPYGGTPTYSILYSRDNGATWVGIASGITGNAYNLDFSGLPGTTGASGLIKVMVSDGFNSTEDISDNPFSIVNKSPSAAVIISPPSGAEFTTGPQVILEGAGMDLEDRSLGDSALSWVSSIDGALGTGQLLEVNLSPGVHTITLTATDSGGLTSTASIQMTVVAQTTSINKLFLPLVIK